MEQKNKSVLQFTVTNQLKEKIHRLREYYRSGSIAHTIRLAIEDGYSKMKGIENSKQKSGS